MKKTLAVRTIASVIYLVAITSLFFINLSSVAAQQPIACDPALYRAPVPVGNPVTCSSPQYFLVNTFGYSAVWDGTPVQFNSLPFSHQGFGYSQIPACVMHCPLATATLLDPVPTLLNGAVVTTDTDLLATQGNIVQGVAADGVAEVVLKIPANKVGERLALTIFDDSGLPSASTQANGTLGAIGAVPSAGPSSLVVSAVNTPLGPMAFAVYRAPVDFVRSSQDEANSERAVAIQIVSLDVPSFSVSAQIVILRPPVVLIHGLWDDTSAWSNFNALTSDARFFVSTLGYSALVTGVTATTPAYSSSTLKKIRQHSLGFTYNATGVLNDIRGVVTDFKNSSHVASVQTDIVAHSMGGDITRALRSVHSFLSSSDTFDAGSVHKLITIGTPHLGTPLAGDLLKAANACTRGLLALAGKIALSSVTASGSAINGAVGDLQGDGSGGGLSSALSRIQSIAAHAIPTALLAGVMTTANSSGLNCHICDASVIRAFCQGDPLADNLTQSNWPTVVGTNSDAIVPLTSQLSGGLTGSQFNGVVHSGGVETLSFNGPSELNDSDISAAVINLLNTTLLDAKFHPL